MLPVFRRHSAREGDIELAVSKTLVVEIDPRFLERLTLGFVDVMAGFVDGHGPAQTNRKLLSRHRKSGSRFETVVHEFDARDEDFLSFARSRDDGGVQTAKPDAMDHDAGAVSKLSRNVAQHNGHRPDFELPAVQGCRVDYFDGNVFVSAGISMDSVDGHQVDYVARQHVGIDNVVEIIECAVEKSQNAAFGKKFGVAFERINVVVVVHGLSRTECSSPSLLEMGVVFPNQKNRNQRPSAGRKQLPRAPGAHRSSRSVRAPSGDNLGSRRLRGATMPARTTTADH